ncbi:MAG TPA: hypothetical protein VIO64_06495 [Pseudobacteroides sp.]|uniref:CsxC family protein n=1 Tax=Pseudobacteroides sp. TaxID=1968840 RepID=UPI002F92784A
MEQTTSHVVSTNSSVLNATTLLASPSQPKKVEGKKVPLVGKIPVVISEADVQVYVDATIQLEEPALEITRVKKNVFLTRSQLLLTDDKKSAKLLISGFVRNSVEYSTARHVGNSSVSGKIRFTVVNIPFKCFTKVDFITEPVTASNPQVLTSSAISPDGYGSDQYALSITNSEILNEKIYCELIESKIRQVDLKKDVEALTQAGGRLTNERTFRAFLESMVIELKLRVMQNQSVFISPIGIGASGDGKSGGGKGGDDKSNDGRGNDGKDGDGKNGDGKDGDGKGGDGKGGDGRGNDGKGNDGKDGDGKGGDGKGGDGKGNDGKSGDREKSKENKDQKDDASRSDESHSENNNDPQSDDKSDYSQDKKKESRDNQGNNKWEN